MTLHLSYRFYYFSCLNWLLGHFVHKDNKFKSADRERPSVSSTVPPRASWLAATKYWEWKTYIVSCKCVLLIWYIFLHHNNVYGKMKIVKSMCTWWYRVTFWGGFLTAVAFFRLYLLMEKIQRGSTSTKGLSPKGLSPQVDLRRHNLVTLH